MKRLILIAALALLVVPAAATAGSPKTASASCKAQLRVMGKTNFQHVYLSLGRCVAKMSTLTVAQQNATLNAARTCRAAQLAGAAAFTARWGINHNKANAFGKCVSATARTGNNGGSTGGGTGGTVSAKPAKGDFTFTAGTNRHVTFDVKTAHGSNPAGGSFSYSDPSPQSYTVQVSCVLITGTTVYIGGLVQNANPALPSGSTYLLAKAVDNGATGDLYSGSFASTSPCPTLGTVSPADGPFALTSGSITVG